MQTISGVMNDPVTIEGEVALSGIANKTITVARGARLFLSGIANGDVIVEPGGEVEVSGVVNGTVRRLASADRSPK